MQLYQTIDGTLIGFYMELGGEVRALMYRDVYEKKLVTNFKMEQVWVPSTLKKWAKYIPGFYDLRPLVIAGYWEDRRTWLPAYTEWQTVKVPGRYERQTVYVAGHYEIKETPFAAYYETTYKDVPGYFETNTEYVAGHYEIQNIYVPAYYVTRFYWQEPHPARGLEGMWKPYQFKIEAGYKDQRVWIAGDYEDIETWIPATTEKIVTLVPAGVKKTKVWVDGVWRTKVVWVDTTWVDKLVTIPAGWGKKAFWVEPVDKMVKVWVPDQHLTWTTGMKGHYETKKVYYTEVVDVWVGYEPVYELVDEEAQQTFQVVELVKAPVDVAGAEDKIVIRNTLTGDELTTTAKYLGFATRVGDNEFVVPLP